MTDDGFDDLFSGKGVDGGINIVINNNVPHMAEVNADRTPDGIRVDIDPPPSPRTLRNLYHTHVEYGTAPKFAPKPKRPLKPPELAWESTKNLGSALKIFGWSLVTLARSYIFK